MENTSRDEQTNKRIREEIFLCRPGKIIYIKIYNLCFLLELIYIWMDIFFGFCLWLFILSTATVRGQLFQQEIYEYCDPKLKLCDAPSDHTMCKYPVAGLSPQCTPAIHEPLSATEKKRILFWHNKFRSNVANGNEKNKSRKLPTSSNMRQIYWDKELEAIAMRWAEQCMDTSASPYDKCRNTKRFQVSQNVGMRKVNGTSIDKQAPQIVISWYKESKDFDPALVDKFALVGDDKVSAKQFSNIIWADTYALGCARVIFHEQQQAANKSSKETAVWTIERLVCNYGPAGNQIGKAVYKRGTSCENCPPGTQCSLVFPGLCAIQNVEKMEGQQNLENQESKEDMTTEPEMFTQETETTSENQVPVSKAPIDSLEEVKVEVKEEEEVEEAAEESEEVEEGECKGEECKKKTFKTSTPSTSIRVFQILSPKPSGAKYLIRTGVFLDGECHCSDIQRSKAPGAHSRASLAPVLGLLFGCRLTNFLSYF